MIRRRIRNKIHRDRVNKDKKSSLNEISEEDYNLHSLQENKTALRSPFVNQNVKSPFINNFVKSPFLNNNIRSPFLSTIVQPKLRINKPDDKYEQEADRIADEILNMKNADIQSIDIEDLVQEKDSSGQEFYADSELESKINNLGSGKLLSESELEFFEPKFGSDFKDVKIHTDLNAGKLAESINARAFTKGNDIVFGESEYSPGTIEGKKLMAHELIHVLQKGGSIKRKEKENSENNRVLSGSDYLKSIVIIELINKVSEFKQKVEEIEELFVDTKEKAYELAIDLMKWVEENKAALELILTGLSLIGLGSAIMTGGSFLGGSITVGSGGLLSVVGVPIATVSVVKGKVLIVVGSATVAAGVAMLMAGKGGEGGKGKKEETPHTNPEKFENVKGRKGKRHKDTGEIWEFDSFHKDHYEVYKNLKNYEKGVRDRDVWLDGKLKEKF